MNPHDTFSNRHIINEVSKRPGIPDRQNAVQILTKTIEALNDFIKETLLKGIGVAIPGLGHAFFVNHFDKVLQKGKRELHFVFEDTLIEPLKLKIPIDQQFSTYESNAMPLGDKYGPIHRLNFMVIGQKAGYDYQDCMEGFQLFMAELQRCIRAGMDGDVDYGFGKLQIKNFNTRLVIDRQFLVSLEQTGVNDNIKTSQVLTGGKTFRPSDHLKPEQIIYK